MSLVGIGAAIAPWLGEWATVAVAGAIVKGVRGQFDSNDMERVLKWATEAAEAAQPETGGLFFRCHRDGRNGVKKFLEQFFQSGEVLKELQRPLQDSGKPDVDILVAAFERSAPGHLEAKNYLSAALKLWMETFVESYFLQVKGICFQVAKNQYLKQLAQQVDDVKFVGIAVSGEEEQKALSQIFVMPDVREKRSQTSRQIRLSAGVWEAMDFSSPDTQILWHTPEQQIEVRKLKESIKQNTLRSEQKEWVMRDKTAPRIPAPKVINLSRKKAVVLGAPGSGKTMLMNYFSLMLCGTEQSDPTQIGLGIEDDWLPIMVKIRDWISSPGIGLLEYLKSNAEVSLACKELPKGFFEHWLDRGRALILLDGLDEVVDEAQRRRVAEQIETFLHQYQDNPAVITSRPAGYRWDFFKVDEFPHYTLEFFDDKQVETFIDYWYDSRLKDDKAQADRRKADLQKAFVRNERIRLLAKNPLLLTIITLIHRYQAELPRQRCKLYEKAVETLLTSWDSGKEIKLYSQVLLYLKSDDLLYILKRLAYWIHTQGSVGETEGGTLIYKDDLIRWLWTEIKTLKKRETHEAKKEAERFIDFIQRRTGLLNEQGRDRYAFVHKTFQEYLTAEEIFDRADAEDNTEIILDHFRQHLHDQHWREVLLLLVSKLKGKKAQKAIQAVLDAKSEYEQWLHRDLLFAGRCLTEDPPELTVVAQDFVGEILNRLVSLEIEESNNIGQKISSEVRKILRCFGETTIERDVWEKLQTLENQIDRFRLLEYQAALGQESAAINTLVNLLENQHGIVSLRAVELLLELGYEHEKMVSCLLRLLKSEQPFIFTPAAKMLSQSGNSNEKLEQRFLLMLNDEDDLTRLRAAQILIQLGNVGEQVSSGLLSLLKGGNSYVCYCSALTLVQLGNASEQVSSGLLSLLKDGNSYTRSNAASVLVQLGNTGEQVSSSLVSLLKDDDSHVRSIAISALGQIGNANSEVVSALRSVLDNEDLDLKSITAISLNQLGDNSPEVISGLFYSLNDDIPPSMKSIKAESLALLSKTSPIILSEVLQGLEQKLCDGGVSCYLIDCLWTIVVD
jgi:HEAT repeat protein